MDLEPIRQKIDKIDAQLVQLLNERLALAAEIGKLKRSQGGQIYVAEREDAVLRKVTGQNQGPIKNEALRGLSAEAARLARRLDAVRYTAVRREKNELADRLVNEALDMRPG